jgi:AcrR family transcriptional regulator
MRRRHGHAILYTLSSQLQDRRTVTRPYALGRRRQTADATRERIIAAARALLATPDGGRAMTIDAVARTAGVTRATVYQQLESKQMLLGAVLDDLARERGLDRLPTVIMSGDPESARDEFIAVLVRFWAADRDLHRHLSALAEIDPTLRDIVRERQERRRKAITMLVKRVDPTLARAPRRLAESVDALFALTSPTMLTQLAERRTPAQIATIVQRLARAAIPPA